MHFLGFGFNDVLVFEAVLNHEKSLAMVLCLWVAYDANGLVPILFLSAQHVFVDFGPDLPYDLLGLCALMDRVVPPVETVLVLTVIHLALNASYFLSRLKIVRWLARGSCHGCLRHS
jgi:hypothetical protein